MRNLIKNRASISKAERCLTIKTREVLRLWYWVRVVVSLWNLSGPRQRCCRHAGQMLEWSDNSNNLSPGFDILRHLVVDVLPISEYMQAHMSLVFNARQIETKSDRIGLNIDITLPRRIDTYPTSIRGSLLYGTCPSSRRFAGILKSGCIEFYQLMEGNHLAICLGQILVNTSSSLKSTTPTDVQDDICVNHPGCWYPQYMALSKALAENIVITV